MRPLIYLTVLSGNFLYRPRRARVVPREFLLRDKALMLDVGNLRRRVETRESFITDETNLMEKKEEGGRKKERKKEGKKGRTRERKRERNIHTFARAQRVESSFILVSPKGEGISRATGLREEPLCIALLKILIIRSRKLGAREI